MDLNVPWLVVIVRVWRDRMQVFQMMKEIVNNNHMGVSCYQYQNQSALDLIVFTAKLHVLEFFKFSRISFHQIFADESRN